MTAASFTKYVEQVRAEFAKHDFDDGDEAEALKEIIEGVVVDVIGEDPEFGLQRVEFRDDLYHVFGIEVDA
jgi:hypothetical protein